MLSSVRNALKAGSIASFMAIWVVAGCGLDSTTYPEDSGQQDLQSTTSALSKNCDTLCKCLSTCDLKKPDVACLMACFDAATPEPHGCMCLGLVPPDNGTTPSDGNTGNGGTITIGSGGKVSGSISSGGTVAIGGGGSGGSGTGSGGTITGASGGSTSGGSSVGDNSGEEGVGISVTSK